MQSSTLYQVTSRSNVDSNDCIEFHRRVPITDIPYENESKCAEWLQQLFQEKDRIYDHFVKHDDFQGLGLPEVRVARNYSDLLMVLFWHAIIGIPSLIWFIQFILSSSLLAKILVFVVILIIYVILQQMINVSVIKTDAKLQKNKNN